MSIRSMLRHFAYNDLIYLFLNYVVSYIPIWSVRKIIYRIFGIKIGKGSRIAMRCIVFIKRGGGITIGNNTIVNEFCVLDGRGGLLIGNDVAISMFSKLYSATHVGWSETFEYTERITILKDNCWIGVGSIVLPGSMISEGVIVGANSVMKGQTKEYCVYAGNPAGFIRKRGINKKYRLRYKSCFR